MSENIRISSLITILCCNIFLVPSPLGARDITAWFDTSNGIHGNSIRDVAFDESGTMWVGSDDGISIYDGSNWSYMTTDDGLPYQNVVSIDIGPEGTVYAYTRGPGIWPTMGPATYEHAISALRGDQWETIQSFSAAEFGGSNLAVASNGDLLIPAPEGLRRFDGSYWYSINVSLASTNYHDMNSDDLGNVWFTDNECVFRYNALTDSLAKWSFGVQQGALGGIGNTGDGRAYAMIRNSLHAFENEEWHQVLTIDEMTPNWANIVLDTSERLWITSGDELYSMDGTTVHRDTLDINQIYFRGLLLFHDTLWAWNSAGVFSIDNNSLPMVTRDNRPETIQITSIMPNPFNNATAIQWIGSIRQPASLSVYSVTGQRIRTVRYEHAQSGSHVFIWDGTNDTGQQVSSGVYVITLLQGTNHAFKKLTLLK